jgi:hypothetical protein
MRNVIDYYDLSDAINEVQNTLYDIEYTLEEDDEDE